MGRVGADAGWLAALGHVIAQRHGVPIGVPFAYASTAHWANPLVLGELIFAGLHGALGDRGLMLAQLIAVAAAMYTLARDGLRGGARPEGTALVLLVVGFGALPSLAIARVQMFSLLLFPALAALLRAEAREPTARIWLALPLLALWSNLHGAALLGAGTLIVYLICARAERRPVQSLVVGVAGVAALCVTPAGLRTMSYYSGLLGNQAAQRGEGLWGPLSLSAPLDVLLLLAAVWLGHQAWRARPALWELVIAGGLAILTVKAGRDGVWLVLFLAVPAARAVTPDRALRALTPALVIGAILALAVGLTRGPARSGAGSAIIERAIAAAHGSPILADARLDEQVDMAGGRVWAGNPVDAFSTRVQDAWLDWLAGRNTGVATLTPAVRVALVARGGAAQRLMAHQPGFRIAARSSGAIVYTRRN
jgi:hypothetical protein